MPGRSTIIDVQDRDFINEAAKRGIFAYIADGHDPQELQSAIDIVFGASLSTTISKGRSPGGR